MVSITQNYILRDPQIDYPWSLSTITTETQVTYNCGTISVAIFMNDGLESSIDPAIFNDNRSLNPTNVFTVK